MKRGLCMLLVLALLFSMSIISFKAKEIDEAKSGETIDEAEIGADVDAASSAYSVPSESDFLNKLSSLKGKYPNKGTWSGTYYENGVAKAWTCHGYACQMVYEVFGALYYTGGFYNNLDYTMGTLNAGDLVRINSDSHSIFITKVTSDRIYFTDANGTGTYNQIRWDASYTVAEMRNKFTYKMHLSGNNLTGNGVQKPSNPWINVSKDSILTGESVCFTFGANNATRYDIGIDKNGTRVITEAHVASGKSYTFNEEGHYSAYVTCSNSEGYIDSSKVNFFVLEPLDFGSYFVAKMKSTASGLYVVSGGTYDSSGYPNVFLAAESSNDNNEWIFERQDDRSYKIINAKTGYCLDVSGGSQNDGTNIGTYPSNDTVSQRWYIRTNMSDGYALAPKLRITSDLSIYGNNSLYNNNIFDGANIALVGNNSVMAQRFVFDYTVAPPDEWISIDKQELTSKEKLTFNFGANGATKYTLCVDRNGNRELTEEVQPGDSFSFDKSGEYTAYVLCSIGDNLTTVKTKTVSFYNLLVYDYGEKFSANIKNTASDYYVTAGKQAPNMSYPDVYIATKATDGSSDWLFERQSDCSYKIINQKTGYVLDLFGGNTDNLTNIDTYPDNDTDAQRWYISNNMDGYALAPKNNYHSYLSICGNNSIYGDCIFDGANIALYGLDNVRSQRFALENIVDLSPDEPSVILGDADGDGEITTVDVTLIMREIAHIETGIDENTLMNGDVDGSGSLEITDATYIQRHLAKMNTPYEIGKAKR